jgi:hypothetical protein
VLVVVLVVLAILGAAIWSAHLKARRRRGMMAFADRYGLDFYVEDPFLISDWPFRLFGLGDGRGCQNVMDGRWQGLPVKAADYWYYTRSTDSQGHTSRDYHRFSVAVAEAEADLPPVAILRENVLTRLAEHVGMGDVRFESERFNREFRVVAGDPRFAYRLVDARMMEWLLAMGQGFEFEVSGPRILAYCRPRGPEDMVPLLGVVKGFHDHVPRLVWTEYAAEEAPPAEAGPAPA